MFNVVADDLLFVLENGPAPSTHVFGSAILQAVDERLSDKLRLGPEGSTKADAWIVRHGDPMTSTEAALTFLHHVLGVPVNVPVGVVRSRKFSSARIGTGRSVTVQGGFAEALCAAGLDHYVRNNGK